MNKKNGTIELFRFVFASCVIFFHICTEFWKQDKTIGYLGKYELTFFENGYIGVEFFFLVSGYLMASSIYRKLNCSAIEGVSIRSLEEDTVVFLWRKVKAILPYYWPACILMTVFLVINGSDLVDIIRRIPSLFFCR